MGSNTNIPEVYDSLTNRGLLDPDLHERLDSKCLWLEGVHWLEQLGPEIVLPQGTTMIPFAMSAYGDWWCWECNQHVQKPGPIILSPPDTGDCTYYAPSFEGFLFRRILQFLSNDVFSEDKDPEEIRFTLEEIRRQLKIWRDQLSPYLPESWLQMLDDVRRVKTLTLHVHSPRFQYLCLLDPDRTKEIENSWLGFDQLNEEFKFNRLAVDWYGD